MSDRTEQNGGSWVAWSLGGLALVYFGFPAVWIWPFSKIYGSSLPDWWMPIVSPLVWLMERFPGYEVWVDWGLKLFGIS